MSTAWKDKVRFPLLSAYLVHVLSLWELSSILSLSPTATSRTNFVVIVQVQGIEAIAPQDGLRVPIGTFLQGPSALDLASLALDSDCFFVEEGGYSLQLEAEETGGGGQVSVILRVEESQCAVISSDHVRLCYILFLCQ